MNTIKLFFLNLQVKLWLAFHNTKEKLADERGDTNFISLAIILIIVIGIAVVFIGFGKEIITWINQKWEELKGALGF